MEGIFKDLENSSFEGYEIHMGETRLKEDRTGNMTVLEDSVQGRKNADGCCRGNVYGTYVHGIFDREEVAVKIVEALAEKKGLKAEKIKSVDLKAFKETQYDLLAEALREHMDIQKIYEIMGE